jgi:hypothetical protein
VNIKLKYTFFFKRFLYYFYGERFYKRLSYDWSRHPSRIEIIQEIINQKKFQNYLEIGCDQDENFSQITIKKKIGVDPKCGGTHRMTSDKFFENNEEKFDIIFLDGLHTYEQTIKDINNSIKSVTNDGLIMIHDCLPKKIWNQVVPRLYGHWNGDVWKAIVEARTFSHVDTLTCTADHGLGIILKRKNSKILEIEKKDFKRLKFSDYYNNHKNFMNPMSFEEVKKILNI